MIIPIAFAILMTSVGPSSAGTLRPLALERVSEIPAWGGITSRDFSLFASIDGRTIYVWRLSDGHQVAAMQLPPLPKAGEKDWVSSYMLDISPDNKSILVAITRGQSDKHDEYYVYLASVADEAAKLVLAREDLYYRPASDPSKGITPMSRVRVSGTFSPDGKRIAVWGSGHPAAARQWDSPNRRVNRLDVVDLAGKSLLELSETAKPVEDRDYLAAAEPVAGARSGGFDAAGNLLGILERANSCEIWNLDAHRRVSFLDGCGMDFYTYWFPSGALVSHVNFGAKDDNHREYRLWDLATGRLVFRAPWSYERFYAPTPDGALVFEFDSAKHKYEVWDTAKSTAVAVSPALSECCAVPNITFQDVSRAFPVSPNADEVILTVDGKIRAYKTGFFSKTIAVRAPEPKLEAALDVDALPAAAVKTDPDAYAVVIGVEKYRQDGIPSVDFAARDAQAMYAYLTGAMGFDAKNVVLLTDERASKTDLEKHLGSWLKNRVGAKSRVFVYYAGHGSPNPETGHGYLMPYEADPAYLEDTAYPLSKLYASLGKLPTRDVTVVLDACFSGQGGRSLIAKGTRPLVSVVQSKAEPNTVVLAAAGAGQVSASFPEARHGLLTYYLLAGLGGAADARHDGKITADELFDYVRPAVERAAKLQNVEQTPTLMAPSGAVPRPWIVLAPKK